MLRKQAPWKGAPPAAPSAVRPRERSAEPGSGPVQKQLADVQAGFDKISVYRLEQRVGPRRSIWKGFTLGNLTARPTQLPLCAALCTVRLASEVGDSSEPQMPSSPRHSMLQRELCLL